MKNIWNKIDKMLNVIANHLFWALVIFGLYLLLHKTIEGRYMMYQDYYEYKTTIHETINNR